MDPLSPEGLRFPCLNGSRSDTCLEYVFGICRFLVPRLFFVLFLLLFDSSRTQRFVSLAAEDPQLGSAWVVMKSSTVVGWPKSRW